MQEHHEYCDAAEEVNRNVSDSTVENEVNFFSSKWPILKESFIHAGIVSCMNGVIWEVKNISEKKSKKMTRFPQSISLLCLF